MKEDVLVRIVEDHLQQAGYFTLHELLTDLDSEAGPSTIEFDECDHLDADADADADCDCDCDCDGCSPARPPSVAARCSPSRPSIRAVPGRRRRE